MMLFKSYFEYICSHWCLEDGPHEQEPPLSEMINRTPAGAREPFTLVRAPRELSSQNCPQGRGSPRERAPLGIGNVLHI